jgi:hypothetical protein
MARDWRAIRLLLGTIGTLGAVRVLERVLYDVAPLDPTRPSPPRS